MWFLAMKWVDPGSHTKDVRFRKMLLHIRIQIFLHMLSEAKQCAGGLSLIQNDTHLSRLYQLLRRTSPIMKLSSQ